jgi:hypothetical protein
MAFGIASWRGLRVSFTDGMCSGCTARFRREWSLPELKTRRAAFGLTNGLARAATVVFVAASFTLAARQLDDVRSGGTMTTTPETVLVPSVPFEDEPMPALAIASRPRRARTDASRVARTTAPRPTQSGPETIESIAEPSPIMVSAFDPAPAVIPSVTASPTAPKSAAVEVAFAVPHAGLTHQAP